MSSPDCQALFTAIVENGGKVWGLKSNVADDDEPKRKGCDIGYALVADSCEGTDSVDARTVTALDAITAFAVPNPNCFSQNQSVFSGLAALPVALKSESLSLLRISKFYLANPFSHRRTPS